ncbi:MAG: ABC transporter, permease protein (cluster 3, basic aa/glutamine/opines) [uncultured Thermoleophilia bacterium]|uniref:ABC transporter, permease protein (Cluster 3, basic aa/glutamine/opines) n=1 Tax=uncultured Thermoleophilia bacterium TaxID=1497501 RepID=A0A6J4UCB7_9ACTN|nr:MAG: ABC transporter, permease protein (cluster 3, basic aa/glutamine/opines) [uncultured Thermoleophilia bacterium]
MSDGTAVLYDTLGPRGRLRVRIASIVCGVLLAALVLLAIVRLEERGQFEPDLWQPFGEWVTWRSLLEGLQATLAAAAVAMALAAPIGLAMALGRLSLNRPTRWLAGGYVELFRAVPLLLFIYFAALGLPRYGIELSAFWYLVLPLVVYNSAVLGEIFRAGILSLDRGQGEAALAIGMTYWQSMLLVVVPQAVRRMVPALVSQLVTLLKDTSLGFVIPYAELLRTGQINGQFYGNLLQMTTVVALIYVAVNVSLGRVAVRLERRQARRYGSAGPHAVLGESDVALLAARAGDGRERAGL